MKKLAAALLAGAMLMLGAANAWATLPSEWGVIAPTSINSTPSYDPATDFGYFIWTDDLERTSWHIRWMDGPNTGTTSFHGLISLENNIGAFATYSFESDDINKSWITGDLYFSNIVQEQNGIDFTISNIGTPSYVGFDLGYQFAGMDAQYIYLGNPKQTVASLGEDQDFAISAPVPEPGTIMLMGAGLVALPFIRRRVKK